MNSSVLLVNGPFDGQMLGVEGFSAGSTLNFKAKGQSGRYRQSPTNWRAWEWVPCK